VTAPEAYLARFVGGPLPGSRVLRPPKWSWPLPDEVAAPGITRARYVKVSQSEVSDEAAREMTHVVRGAEYVAGAGIVTATARQNPETRKTLGRKGQGRATLQEGIIDLVLDVPRTSTTFVERVFCRVEIGHPAGCWFWTGTLDQYGYGVLGRGRRGAGNIPAHRAVWLLLVGPIPDGMESDHRCRNHPCVNPDHLEIVTGAENKRRGYSPARLWALRTQCGQGHPLDGVTRCHRGKQAGQSWRYCKTCRRQKQAAYKQRKAAA
jgi:hypothetical protein